MDDLTLPGVKGLSANAGERGDQLIIRLLENSAAKAVADGAPHVDCFIDRGQTVFWAGTLQATAVIYPFNIQQGTSLGEAIDQIVATGNCDVVLDPIYDPLLRPGLIADLNIYVTAGVATGKSFRWDLSPWSAAAISRLLDGAQMGNVIQFYNGQGGPPVTRKTDAGSVAKYGQYWAQQFFPSQTDKVAVEALAAAQRALRRYGKQTITLDPTPEIAVYPFTSYFLGDTVRVRASSALRDALNTTLRVQSIPIKISDNALEQVIALLVSAEDL
jgi:hypothetical protein